MFHSYRQWVVACYKILRQASRHSVTVLFNFRIVKTSDLSERGMIVGATCASISETSGVLGFSRMKKMSRVYGEWCDKQKHPVSASPVGINSLLMRDRRRMAQIVRANRQISVQYNNGVQNGISEHTACRSLSWMVLLQQTTTPGYTPIS
jgi:uncharacterized protein with gpF-like domain